MRWWGRRITPAVVALACVAASAGCSDSKAGGVGVRNIESDVVFGAAVPANTGGGDVSEEEATAFDDIPDQFFEDVVKPRRTVTTQPEPECPPAALEEFPDAPAGQWAPEEKKGPPREGLYRWKREGIVTSDETAGRPIEVRGFERRLIRNVEVISTTETPEGGNEIEFTYEVVQPEISGTNIIVTTYLVKSVGTPPTRSVFNPTRGQDEVTAGEPERGMVIKRIEVLDRNGGQVSLFEPPTTGLLIMPYRVRPGEQWQSVAVDPRSSQRLEILGNVLERKRVDACGDLIEGWEVTATLNSSGPDGSSSNTYEYIVAPQYGSILLYERIAPVTGAEENDLKLTIGQQDPDPLPEGAEASE